MERIFDKSIVFVFCLGTLLLAPFEISFVVGMLLALAVAALCEIGSLPRPVRLGLVFSYLVLAVFVPGLVLFVPLAAYDCFRVGFWVPKFGWLVPLLAASTRFDLPVLFFVLAVAVVACGLSWRSSLVEAERASYQSLRDQLRELSISLEQKNRDLQDKQDYEVTVATMAERGRIAREIHDNVGHLLTRSLLQIEALQVVHAGDARVEAELGQVGGTLHEAFDTVRKSVHDLHEEAFDLQTQLLAIAEESKGLEVSVDYQAETMPTATGYCFVAIVREALSNAARHSDARHAKVSVTEYPGFYQLVVHDDGSRDPLAPDAWGMPGGASASPAQQLADRGPGIGLKTMEERTRSLGGVLRIDYEKGLRVFASIPKEHA